MSAGRGADIGRRRIALGLAALLGTLPWTAKGRPPIQRSRKRPNVILIVADDMAWGDLRCHGNFGIDTPNLDRLAGESLRFDRFIVNVGCTPTRAALLTGRYHLRTGTTGAVTRGLETMRTEEVTIAELLRANGYATGMVGKWHNGAHFPFTPNAPGFDDFFGYTANALTGNFDATLIHNGVAVGTRGFVTDVLTDRGIDFISKPRAAPFFLYLAHAAPHAPMQLGDRYFDKYKSRGFNDFDAAVYGMVENLDENTGRLLQRLDALGIADDTVVIFVSDNGPQLARFNGGMKGIKGQVDEGGVRVPAFIRYPRLRARSGRAVGGIAAHIDLFPTIAALTGSPIPAGLELDGVSQAGTVAGDPPPVSRMIYTHALASDGSEDLVPPPFPGAVRTERLRAINKGGGWELYDIVADPAQQLDLADSQSALVARFDAAYRAWFADATRNGFTRPVIPVGYDQAPTIELAVAEASLSGGVRWVRPLGLNGDWIVNWSDTDDRISWRLNVVRRGRYAVTADYACPARDVGARFVIEAGAARLFAKVSRSHDPAPVAPVDRVPRVVPERIWATLDVGVIRLDQGPVTLSLRALEVPGAQVAELVALRLRKLG